MKFTENYPLGGHDKMWEPLRIEVTETNLSGINIQGRTWSRDGAEIKILHDGELMITFQYNHRQTPGYENQMAVDVANNINCIMEMNGLKARTSYTKLLQLTRMIRDKCESRYGNPIPNTEYEVLAVFI